MERDGAAGEPGDQVALRPDAGGLWEEDAEIVAMQNKVAAFAAGLVRITGIDRKGRHPPVMIAMDAAAIADVTLMDVQADIEFLGTVGDFFQMAAFLIFPAIAVGNVNRLVAIDAAAVLAVGVGKRSSAELREAWGMHGSKEPFPGPVLRDELFIFRIAPIVGGAGGAGAGAAGGERSFQFFVDSGID
jgi:hypothetical protein